MKRIVFIVAFVLCCLTHYGQQTGAYTDPRDGKVYKTVKIGNQIWFAENLAFKTDSGCYAYDDNGKFAAIYGYLYSFRSAEKVCPPGWHLPTDSEWKQLIEYLSGESVAGGKLKATHGWNSPNTGASDTVLFSAFPGGQRWGDGNKIISQCSGRILADYQTYDFLGIKTYWWGSYIAYRDVATFIGVSSYIEKIIWGASNAHACYARYIKD